MHEKDTNKELLQRYKVYLNDGTFVYVDATSSRKASEKVLRKFPFIEVEEVELTEDQNPEYRED